MASEDIQIVSVAKIECICLNRRPGSRGEAINLTDGSVDFDPGLGATILETSSRRKRSTKSIVEDDSAIDSVERLTRSPEVAFISSVPAKSRSSRLKASRADESVKITCVSQPPRKKSRKVSQRSQQNDVEIVAATKVKLQSDVESESKPARQKAKSSSEPEIPTYWTNCDRCGGYTRRYHLIDVNPNCQEWFNVCVPLLNASFCVTRLQRIQNQALWQRLQCERQLMSRGHPAGFDLNERLLYHTSRAVTQVICAEGLDQRLSRSGNFGRGIYFSDNPRKCDAYWMCPQHMEKREMFACRVLLGDIKVYPMGHHDNTLVREPPKPTCSSTGDTTQTFDSVLGNMNGFNEFVVYNTYRVMPEYVIEYELSQVPPLMQTMSSTPYSANPSVPLCHRCGELTNSHHCKCL